MSDEQARLAPSGLLTAGVVKYYRVYVLLVVAVLIYGVWTFLALPRAEDPEFDVGVLQVLTLHPGVISSQIETLVTRPIEEAIEELEGIETIESTSAGGISLLDIQLEKEAIPDDVLAELKEKVEGVRDQLPAGVGEPEVYGYNTAEIPVTLVSLLGPADYTLLNLWAERIRDELRTIPAVSKVGIEGLPERQILVNVDNERLAQYRIPLSAIVEKLRLENAAVAGGKLDVGSRRYLVKNPNEYRSLEDIGETVIGSFAGSVIFLEDAAEIEDGFEDSRYLVRTNGRTAALLTVTKRERTNTVVVGEEVRARVAEIAATLPPELELRIVSDRGLDVADFLGNLGYNALAAAVIVIALVTLFLGIRQAFVVSVAIPLSVLLAFIGMSAFSIELNQVSIFGLVLALGMLVDSGLVVVENIERHQQEGLPLYQAVTRGVEQVRLPVLSSTLTTVAAFIPLLFLTGDIGRFTFGLPMTLIFSLGGSLLVAVTVIPLLSYALWKSLPSRRAPRHRESRLLDAYTEVAKTTLRNRAATLLIAVVAFGLAVVAIPRLGLQFFPRAEKDLFLISIRLPRESNFEATGLVTAQVEELLGGERGIRDFTAYIGKGGPRVYYTQKPEMESPHYAQILVNLEQDLALGVEEYVKRFEKRLAQVAGASVQAEILEQGPRSGAAIQIRLVGDDLETLAQLAQRIQSRIEAVPGLVDVRDTLGEKSPRLMIDLDKVKAGLLGVDTFGFSRTVFVALNGEVATRYRSAGEEIPVVVRLNRRSVREVSDVARLYVPAGSGGVVPFAEVAEVREQLDFATIQHRDGDRVVRIDGGVRGRLPNDVLSEIRRLLAELSLPEGYSMSLGGENEEILESFGALGRALVVALLLIYGILALQFNSFIQPFVILFTVPFGIIGAVVGLFVTGNPFGFMAFIGIVSLTGIIINDSIVLTDFANYLQRQQGKGINEALLEAGRIRFRPVILTSITTIAGMTPLAIWGGSLWSPLASAVIFGLMGATILILVVLPVIYSTLIGQRERNRQFRVWPVIMQRLLRKERV
jgi:multidrug efflux pump subunit AcrB